MTDAETVETAKLLKEIAKTRSVVVVEHDMHFVDRLCERVVVIGRTKRRRDPVVRSTSLAMPSGSAAAAARASLLEETLTDRPSDCISLTRTLKDSGVPASRVLSPLTMAS